MCISWQLYYGIYFHLVAAKLEILKFLFTPTKMCFDFCFFLVRCRVIGFFKRSRSHWIDKFLVCGGYKKPHQRHHYCRFVNTYSNLSLRHWLLFRWICFWHDFFFHSYRWCDRICHSISKYHLFQWLLEWIVWRKTNNIATFLAWFEGKHGDNVYDQN